MQRKSDVKSWVKYFSSAIIGLVIALVVCFARGILGQTETSQVLKILCDAFTIPGIVLTGVGLLSLATADGTFDGLAYSFKSMKNVRTNYRHDASTPKTYYDYKESVKKKRKTNWHFIFVGLAYLAVSLVILQIYNRL